MSISPRMIIKNLLKMKTTLTVLLIMELLELASALNKQHYFVNKKKTWYTARRYCKQFYSDLSTFTDNSEELQFVSNATTQSSDAWVGLYKYYGVWTWLGVETATQIDWDTQMNQPDNINENCGFLYEDSKKIHDGACNVRQAFYCMTMTSVVAEGKSWDDALEYCRNNYNDLASLSSSYNMNLALGTIAQAQTEYVWAGLRFLAGEWTWISGEDFDTALSMSGQPQCPARNLRCGALNKQTRVWMPRDCEERLSFICQ